MAYTASQRVSVVGIAGQFLGVRFVGRKLFIYQRIIFRGIAVLFSRVFIPGGTKIGL